MYAEPKEDEFKVYDFNSFYPYIIKNPKMLLPCGKPEYQTLEEVPKIVAVGIYRAVISGYDRRVFLPNNGNYYTYIDIKRAIELKYKIEMIQDGKPNFIYYKKRVQANNYLPNIWIISTSSKAKIQKIHL